jgi:hypothetical protein
MTSSSADELDWSKRPKKFHGTTVRAKKTFKIKKTTKSRI